MISSSRSLGALRFPVPADWSVQQHVMLQLPCPPDDGVAFQPNIIVVIRAGSPDSTIEALAEERWRGLQQLSQFQRGLSLWGQLFGQRAVRMSYGWHNGTYALRQVLMLCMLDDWLYEITFSDVAARFDRSLTELEGWLSSLALVTAEPPK
jgi:hypothetical protein